MGRGDYLIYKAKRWNCLCQCNVDETVTLRIGKDGWRMKEEGDDGWMIGKGGWRRERMKDKGWRRWWMNDSIGMDRDEESRMKERKDEKWRMKEMGDES